MMDRYPAADAWVGIVIDEHPGGIVEVYDPEHWLLDFPVSFLPAIGLMTQPEWERSSDPEWDSSVDDQFARFMKEDYR